MIVTLLASLAVALTSENRPDENMHRFYFGDHDLCLEIEMKENGAPLQDAHIERMQTHQYFPDVESCNERRATSAVGSDQLVEPNVFMAVYEQAEQAFRAETSIIQRTASSTCQHGVAEIGRLSFIQWPKIGRSANVEVFAPLECDDGIRRSVVGEFQIDFENGMLHAARAWIVIYD